MLSNNSNQISEPRDPKLCLELLSLLFAALAPIKL